MYTTSWCGFCARLKYALKSEGIAWTEVDIEAEPEAAEFVGSVNGGNHVVPTVKFADGSICGLTYTALGDKSYPKERMEIFADGKVIVMDDYKLVEVHGGKHRGWSAKEAQKGQLQELEALADTLLRGKPWPISLEQQLQATRIAFEVERQLAPQPRES